MNLSVLRHKYYLLGYWHWPHSSSEPAVYGADVQDVVGLPKAFVLRTAPPQQA